MMSKDFDADRSTRAATEQEREFVIGGERFVIRQSTPPEPIVRYWDAARTARDISNAEFVEITDETVKAMLEPEFHETWERVRRVANPALSLKDISDVIEYAMEVQAGRPTGQSSDSSTGSEETTPGIRSTDDSSSRVVEASPV
jgi:hypothetical protein